MNNDTSILKGFKFGAGISLALLISVFVIGIIAQSINTFQNGQILTARQLNDNIQALNNANEELRASIEALQTVQVPPVGAIVAWNKNIVADLTLPAGWLECNGQQVLDTDSPLDGAFTPNLNNPPGGRAADVKGYYLRGSNTSGLFQGDVFRNHQHSRNIDNEPEHDMTSRCCGSFALNGFASGAHPVDMQYTGNVSTLGVTGNETRPLSYSVVWIMRIK